MSFNQDTANLVDWSVKDVMIGTVRDDRQLEFIIKYNGYYAPAVYVNKNVSTVKYIALYETGANGRSDIHRYGRVCSVHKLKRSRIPVPTNRNNGDEPYFYFQLRCWEDMPQPIEIRDTRRGQPLFTNKFLLENCSCSYQLFCAVTAAEYRLMALVDKAFEDLRGFEPYGYCNSYPINEGCDLVMAQGCIALTDDTGSILEKISYRDYECCPGESFNRIKKTVEAQKKRMK